MGKLPDTSCLSSNTLNDTGGQALQAATHKPSQHCPSVVLRCWHCMLAMLPLQKLENVLRVAASRQA